MKKVFMFVSMVAALGIYSCHRDNSKACADMDYDTYNAPDGAAANNTTENDKVGDLNDRGNYESDDTDYGRMNHSKNLSDQGNDASPDTGIDENQPGASNRKGTNDQPSEPEREVKTRTVPGSGDHTGTGIGGTGY